jgi:hypothetical protein
MSGTPGYVVSPDPRRLAEGYGHLLRKTDIQEERIHATTQLAGKAEARANEALEEARSVAARLGVLEGQIAALIATVKITAVIIGAVAALCSIGAALAARASNADTVRSLEAQIGTLKTDLIRRELEQQHAPRLDWGTAAAAQPKPP